MKTLISLAAAGALAVAVPALADTTTPPTGSTTPTAQQQCRTERAQMGTATFDQTYGTNKNKKNAFGKCVSARAKATAQAQQQSGATQSTVAQTVNDQVKADVSAAKSCRAEQKADPAAFAAKYGTNKNKKNAFGKCVSTTAKAKVKQHGESGQSHGKAHQQQDDSGQ